MGIFDSIFGGSDGPSAKQVASAVKALETRHGEPVRRYEAADRLAKWGTPEALLGLLRRYTFNAPAEMSDEDEKSYVADLLAKAGRNAVVPIEKHCLAEAEVAWPLRVLERIVTPEEYRDRVCGLLGKLDTHFDRLPERKVDMLHAVASHASEPVVTDAVYRFLDDTDDTVRMAAIEILLVPGGDAVREALLECLVASGDRPRVLATILDAFASRQWSLGARVEEVRKLLPSGQGYTISKEGILAKSGK